MIINAKTQFVTLLENEQYKHVSRTL